MLRAIFVITTVFLTVGILSNCYMIVYVLQAKVTVVKVVYVCMLTLSIAATLLLIVINWKAFIRVCK